MRELQSIAIAFLMGSIPFGLLLTRWQSGIDIRNVGSGNIGATNAMRAGGAAVGIATLILDGLKGVAGLSMAAWLLNGWPHGWREALLIAAPVLGHCFTPWLGFRGGKGVATAAGVLAWVDWRLLLAGLVAFAAIVVTTRFVSLSSIGCAAMVGAVAPLVHGWTGLTSGVEAVVVVVVWRHRENIGRLLRGTEPRTRERRRPATAGH
ncbi:MAG: glycerol-3-phosphate 1-O-acyltransferase PlsY [Acidobacteriota bacterium]